MRKKSCVIINFLAEEYYKPFIYRYQSKVSGNENENGDLSESDNDEEPCPEDTSVIKPSKHKEKVLFIILAVLLIYLIFLKF